MYTISKQFEFSASHQLMDLPFGHPCAQIHGHNYKVVVELRTATLDYTGFVKDYRALSPIKDWLDMHLDHAHLNDVLPFNPTSENMAKYLYEKFKVEFPELCAVTISETDKTSARYEP